MTAVRELSDLISLAAQVHDQSRAPERATEESAALWLAERDRDRGGADAGPRAGEGRPAGGSAGAAQMLRPPPAAPPPPEASTRAGRRGRRNRLRPDTPLLTWLSRRTRSNGARSREAQARGLLRRRDDDPSRRLSPSAARRSAGSRRSRLPCPSSALRWRRSSTAPRRLGGRRPARPTYTRDTYRQAVITEVYGVRRLGQDHGLHPARQPGPRREPRRGASRSRPAAPTSAARSGSSSAAGNFICPCHGGVYDFEGKVIGGPPVRPLDRFQTRVMQTARLEIGPRYSVTSRPRAGPRPRPGRVHRRDLGVPLPAALHDRSTPLIATHAEAPIRTEQAARSPASERRECAPTAPAPKVASAQKRSRPESDGKLKEAGIDVVGWVDERTGATPFLTGLLLRKVPKGTNWFYTLGSATLFAFAMQALTGVFLAMYYVPSSTEAYNSITHLTNDVFLGEFVRGLHKWGATRDDHPDLPAHGQDVLLRRLQVPARAQLGDRRRAADPDDGHGPHRLPAAVRPALLLGDDRGHEHHRLRPDRRPLPGRLPARRRRVRGDDAARASTRSTCCSCPGRSSP